MFYTFGIINDSTRRNLQVSVYISKFKAFPTALQHDFIAVH